MVPDSGDSDDGDDRPDLLGHGWTPSFRLRSVFYLAVGLLLVTHPLVGGLPDAVGLTGDVEYSAAEISVENGTLAFAWVGGGPADGRSVRSELAQHGGLALVDCYADLADLRTGR